MGFGPVLGAGGAHRPGARPPSPLPAAETEARQFKGSLWGPSPLVRSWPFVFESSPTVLTSDWADSSD